MKVKKYCLEKKVLVKFILIALLICIDLGTKAYFAQYFKDGNNVINIFGGLISFTYLENSGAAFGSFADSTTLLTIISVVFIACFIIIDINNKSQTGLYVASYSLIIAGAIGNVVDRLSMHYVRDFIKFSFFNFVCNIADICICVGVVLFVLDVIIVQSKGKSKKNE